MLDSVRSILSSGRPDDVISGELAELLGFDELELVVSEILSNRSQFFEEPGVVIDSTLTPLPSKSKGKGIGKLCSITTKEAAHFVVPDSRSLAPDQVRKRMEEQLQANASRPLYTGTAVSHTGLSSYGASHVKLKRVAWSTGAFASCVHLSLEHGWW
jgi:antiviral helicase SLH1